MFRLADLFTCFDEAPFEKTMKAYRKNEHAVRTLVRRKMQPEVVVAPDKLISIVQMRKKYSTLVANTYR